MNKKEIAGCVSRYKEVIGKLKKRPGMETQQLIAEKMLYKRGETISEYGNMKNFREPKFREFVGLLNKVFDVNPDYVLQGVGPRFSVPAGELAAAEDIPFSGPRDMQIKSLEYSISLLDAQIRKLKEQSRG